MPKTYPKPHPKKSKQKKKQPKAQSKPVSLMNRKSYWIMLTSITLVSGLLTGYLLEISWEKEALAVTAVLVLIGFAFHAGYKPSSYNKKATFIFAGASIVGFSIWAAMVLSLNAAGIIPQIASSIGIESFAITSLMICFISGAFIGDVIGKNREGISFFVNNKLRK